MMEIKLKDTNNNSFEREIEILKVLTDREGYYFVEELENEEDDYSIEIVAFIAEFKIDEKPDFKCPSYTGIAAFYFDYDGVLICNPLTLEPMDNLSWCRAYNEEQLINYVDYKNTCLAVEITPLNLLDVYRKKKAKSFHRLQELYRN